MSGDASGSRLGKSLATVRRAFANPDLRRIQIAWFGGTLGHHAYFLAISIYAFQQGGPSAVGIAAVVRMVPAAALAPFAATLADRHPRQRVMVISDLARAIVLAGLAVAIFAGASLAVAIALATLAGVLSTPFEPAKSALLPSLARTPEELTAANLASSTTESITLFLGPALTGAILAATGPGEAVLFSVAMLLWSAFFLVRIGIVRPDNAESRASTACGAVAGEDQDDPGDGDGDREATSLLRETAAGFRAIGADSRLAVVIGLMAAQTFVFGAFSVLIVVLALEMLATGDSGVGFLNAAVGVGALIGSGVALGLVGNRRLARAFGLGVFLWGAPLIVIGILVNEVAAVAMMATVGVANTIVDVSALTLLQRIAPEEVLARVFGVMETLIIASIALGSVLVLPLIYGLGNEEAFVVCGMLLPLLVAASWSALRRIDASAPVPTRALELLERVPLFAPLGPAALEELVARSREVRAADGEAIVAQGEEGELFYVVAAGEIEVTVDGRYVRTEGAGAHFGEIALLRDVPRTATVTARGEVELIAVERDVFLDAVTGHPRSSAAAEAVIGARLGLARPATSAAWLS